MKVWSVHTTYSDEVRATQAIFSDESQAHEQAAFLSRCEDHRVLAVNVVLFELDRLGTRSPVAMYVDGVRQRCPYVSDSRAVHAGGRTRH